MTKATRRGRAAVGGNAIALLQLAGCAQCRRALVLRRPRRRALVDVRQHRAGCRGQSGGRVELLSLLDVHAASAAGGVFRRRCLPPVLRRDTARQSGRDAGPAADIRDLRTARSSGARFRRASSSRTIFPASRPTGSASKAKPTSGSSRGLSLSLDASASRIRDQLALPRRDATPEEVLLRLRQLSSGFETRAEIGLTYQFGSRFASIVNPRFGQ